MRFSARASCRRHVVVFALGALAFLPVTAVEAPAASAPKPIVVEHAWKQFLAYRRAVSELPRPDDGDARLEVARQILLAPGNRFLRGYFAERGGGAELGLSQWVALPDPAFASLEAVLADERVQATIEEGAADLVSRLHGMPSAPDTVAFVFLVGGFQNYFTSFMDGGTNVIAVQLESFVPPPADLPAKLRREIDAAIQWRPDSLATAKDLFPWCAYAYTQSFLPELRERIEDRNATLAEYTIFHGFSARLAAALYPESVFAGGSAPVHEAAAEKIEPRWREIGNAWYSLGDEPFPLVLYDERMSAAVPEGTTSQQAIAVLGVHLAEEWLFGTRVGPNANEAAEIARLGRVPTRMVWQLIEAY